MKILGIDPGLNVTGYGIIDGARFSLIEAGVIRTEPRTPVQERLKKIYDALTGIVKEHAPDVLVLEKIYAHYKHPTTAILMAHARAVICLACGEYNVKLVSYPSTRVKKSITGNGHASKTQVQHMVKTLLKLKALPQPADVSDALAMAIAYCYIEKRVASPLRGGSARPSGGLRTRE